MDEPCKSCLRLCKRLDADDKPERYNFCNLTVNEILNLVEKLVLDYPYWQLCVDKRERSTGDQLIVSFNKKNEALHSSDIILIAIVMKRAAGTSLWFRYAMPEDDCKQILVVREFGDLIHGILDVLFYMDRLLVKRQAV
ncbi:hypothetical protein KF913_05365 [Candidatus Obscuribacterales bacterium]|nr:hypothetical protein [Candidatus Obscuribacterales bacterium]